MNTVIRISNLTKTYRVYRQRRLLAAQPIHLLTRHVEGELLYALQDVSFEVGKGEIFGIIGHNGSGKSTLLKILSGITRSDSGSIEIQGRVTSLLELGVGFEQELTGRENIYLYGSLIGLPREMIEEKEQSIIKFSGIEKFIDMPVQSYSSGMLIRLAFATAVHTEPDILLLDEVMGVGDSEFQHRCFQAIQSAVERGVTVLIVSHGLSFIGSFCSRVMCLHQGHVAAIGTAEQVVHIYTDSISSREKICEISRDDLHIQFLPAGFHIEKSGRILTLARGLSVNLRKWESDFMSSEAAWTVVDLKEDAVHLRLRWGHWNLEVSWYIRIENNRTINWTIKTGRDLYRDVDDIGIEAMVSESYKTYILPEEFRDFPRTINRGFNMEYLLSQLQPRRFLGVTGSTDPKPSLVLDFSKCPMTGSSMVITGGNMMPGHILQRMFPAESGQDTLEMQVKLFDQDDLIQFWRMHQKAFTVESGGLVIKLQNDSLTLDEQNTPLTREPGIHVRINNDMYSFPCEWEVLQANCDLQLRATSLQLPLALVWTFCSLENGIRWTLELEFLERLTIDDIRICIPVFSERGIIPDIGIPLVWDARDQMLTATPSFSEMSDFRTPGKFLAGSGIITSGGLGNE
ncbi:ABC transporter ATP-binding protein [bacterium]|nr:ABC transporter ATP-binding protein [candidate division CSSED10-310 bacterium]